MHIKKSVLFFAMLVGLQVPAFAEDLPFGGRTLVAGQALGPSESGGTSGTGGDPTGGSGGESTGFEGAGGDSQHPNPRTGGVPRASDEIRAEDVFGGSIVMVDTKIPLSSNSFAALSTEKYDVSLPSRLREQSPRDYEFCAVLLNAVNGKEYEFDLKSDEVSFDLTGGVAQALRTLREECVTTPLPSQAETGSATESSETPESHSSDEDAGSDSSNEDAESDSSSGNLESSQDLRSKLRRSYRASLPFRESGTRVYISVADLDKYLQDVGATVDSSLLSVRFMIGNAKLGWDIAPELMKATIKDKLSRYERSDVGDIPALPSVDSGEVALTFIRWDDLRRPTGLTPDQMRPALSGVLPEYADFIAYCERTYGVNAAFVNAVAQSECGAGTAGFGRSDSRCNLFSIRNSSGAYKDYTRDASGIDEAYRNSIEDFCILVSKMYLTPSGVYWGGSPTSYGVSKYYAESPTWADAIENARQEFYSKLN